MKWSYWRQANHEWFVKQLRYLPRTHRLIDLGCGPIQFADIFKQFDYTGVDKFDPNLVGTGFENIPTKQLETKIIEADLTQRLPLNNECAEIVTISNVLEHMPEPLHLLKESYRLLVNGGLIFGTVPFLVAEHQEPIDFNRYTHFQLQRLLELAGFKDIEVESLGNQWDVYDTIELKVFEQWRKKAPSVFLELVRGWRRLEMRFLRLWFGWGSASHKVTEGYCFKAKKI